MAEQEQNQVSREENLRNKLALLPDKSGCYLMKNEQGEILYVGKAKVLKNRVRSYFTGSHDTKTQRLVQQIADFEVIVTESDVEALILECNLIKQHKPRYNVLLKDDKSFPYIKITNERHPRLEVTRKIKKDKGKYFGPYPNASAAQETKKLLDRLYPLRKCKTLPKTVCLYYHLGQCVAPCEFEVDEKEYERIVQEITRFLNGSYERIRKHLQEKMEAAAEQLQFERAAELRDLIRHIDVLMEKQKITVNDGKDRDVFGYVTDKGWMGVQILHMRQGKMIERHVSLFPYYGEAEEDFATFVTQYYSDHPALPKEILLPENAMSEELREQLEKWLNVKVHIPKRGLKKQMVRMAEQNAATALEQKFGMLERDEERTIRAVENLGARLGTGPLRRIEAFDNSSTQGTDPVSAMVVFTDGRPDRKEYRKYKIRTVEGADDYEMMREVIRRRYERVLKENLPLPDLIIVDGGKGQLSAAIDVLENELGLSIPVCGLVKDEKHRTSRLITGDPPRTVDLPRTSQEFYLLQRIQEEVHRFAITYHRQRRVKSMVASLLDEIPGIGEKRRNRLLRHFGSLKRIREASVEELKEAGISERLARDILKRLNG